MEENLEKYKYFFNDKCQNTEDIISDYSLNKIDFYGLFLCYLNNYINEKFKVKFNELYKNDRNTLFEVLLKYKSYFKKQINLNLDILNQIILYATQKDYKEFETNGLFYLNNIETFLEIIEKNKEVIIKIENFKPIEVRNIQTIEKINFDKILDKIEEVLNFSLKKKILLIKFKVDFWESIPKLCSDATLENIKICFRFREKFIKYIDLLNNSFKNEKKIKKEIESLKNKDIFIYQLVKNIENYIKNNPKITNIEIIELIKNYHIYYQDDNFIDKRDPDILNKIDLEKLDDDFEEKYREMKFEEKFKNENLKNYLLVFLEKINKIIDFESILRLIDIKKLGDQKSSFLESLKPKYKTVVKESDLLDDTDKKIRSLANLAYFMCNNESNLDFLQNMIIKSQDIEENEKHKIYLELINLCKKDKNKIIIEFISNLYTQTLKSSNLNEFIEFLSSLEEEDSNNLIEHLDDKYIIIKNEFYKVKDSLNIQLLNLLKQKIKLENDNNYIKNNISVLEKIFEEIDEKKIKYQNLKNLLSFGKEVILKKLEALLWLKDKNINIEDIYDNLMKYFQNMELKLQQLKSYKDSLNIYHQNGKKEEISKLNSNIQEIEGGTYKSFNNKRFEIQTLLESLKDTVERVNEIKYSKIFEFFHKKYKNKSIDNDAFDKAYTESNDFKKKLAKKGAQLLINPSNKDSLYKTIKEMDKVDEIKEELNALLSKGNDEEVTRAASRVEKLNLAHPDQQGIEGFCVVTATEILGNKIVQEKGLDDLHDIGHGSVVDAQFGTVFGRHNGLCH